MSAPTSRDADFDDDGRLVSRTYGDVFFSGDGVAETGHVFVAGNELPARFAACDGAFVIGETGFGTGLNFLVAAQRFLANVHERRARLVFVSTEQHPLDDDTLARAHARLPDALRERAEHLRRAWRARSGAGALRAAFDDGRVVLHVLGGDATTSLRAHTFAADAWFLDGFAPSRNPAMWSGELLGEVAAHTVPGGTFATYTVAGAVRRGLQQAGFTIERAAGHGQKREMLRGRLADATRAAPAACRRTTAPRRVVVHGAGIAGAAAARAFERRGCEVLVNDPNGVATGASGVPAAVVRPRLWLPGPAPDAELVAHAFRHAIDWLPRHTPHAFRRTGVLLLATDAADEASLRRRADNPATCDLAVWCDRDAASERAGVPLPFGAAWVARGGHCDLSAATRELLAGIPLASAPDDAQTDPDTLRVLATAAAPDPLLALRETRPTRGQAIAVRWPADAPQPNVVLCTSGYLCPPGDAHERTWLGSTYDRDDASTEARAADDARVRAKFDDVPLLREVLAGAEVLARFCAVRSTTPNRMPLVGFVGDDGRLATSLAHGSRGAVTAPFAAELLAAAALAEPLPIPADLWRRLQPR